MYIEKLLKLAEAYRRNEDWAFIDRWEFGKVLREAVACGEIRSVREAYKLMTDAGFRGLQSDVGLMYDLGECSRDEVNEYLADYRIQESSPWEYFKKARKYTPAVDSRQVQAKAREATQQLKKPFRTLVGVALSEAELTQYAFEVVAWAMDNHPDDVQRVVESLREN